MKKLISFILTGVLLIGVMTVPVYAKTSNNDAAIDSRAEVFLELGIFDGYVPNAQVTRYTVSKSFEKIMGNNIIATKFFGENYTDKPLNFDNVLAVMLDALGYTEYINASAGGYNANSRYTVARRIGLIDGKVKSNAKVDMALYTELLWNAVFEVKVLEISGVEVKTNSNQLFTYDNEQTISQIYLNLKKISGVVDGICGVNIKSGIDTQGTIFIGDKHHKYSTAYPERYVGRYVDCYVDIDTDRAMAVRVLEDMNEELTLYTEEIDSKTNLTRLYYYNDKQRIKNIKLDNIDVVYNGVLFEGVTDTSMIQQDGIYTFIDNDQDGKAEVMLLDVYIAKRAHLVSKGTGSTYLTTTDGVFYDFEKFYEDGNYVENADGNPVEWIEISKNDILLIRRGKLPGTPDTQENITDINRVIWCMDKVNGLLKGIEDGGKTFCVDDAKYELTPALYNDADTSKRIKLGDEITCFMDAFGRIAFVDVYNSPTKIAAVIDLYPNIGRIPASMKCLTEDSKIETLSFKESILLDGRRIDSSQLFTSTYKFKLFTGDKITEQLVKIKINSKNEITSLTTADGIDNDGFDKINTKFVPSYYEAFGLKTLNGKYIADSGTKIFDVWPEEDSFSYVSPNGYLDSETYTLYCVDQETNHVGYILNSYRNYTSRENDYVWGGGNTYLVLGSGMMVDSRTDDSAKFIECWFNDRTIKLIPASENLKPTNKNDNSLALLTAQNYGTNKLYSVLQDNVGLTGWKNTKFTDLKPGTLISVNVLDGYVASFDVVFSPDYIKEDLKNGTWNTLPFEGCPTYNNNNSYFGIDKTRFYHDLIYAYGQVQRMTPYGPIVNNHLPTDEELKNILPDGTEITKQSAQQFMNGQGPVKVFPMSDWDRIYPIDSTETVWFYDVNREIMTRGDFADVQPGDRAFVRRQQGNILMIVYR